MSGALSVHLFGQQVGRLEPEAGLGLRFTYSEEALANEPGAEIPLSLRLPREPGDFPSGLAMPYFANLVPCGQARERLARCVGVSETNVLALLTELGGDCPGAVSFHVDESVTPSQRPRKRRKPLDGHELSLLLNVLLPKQPLLAGADDIRQVLPASREMLSMISVDEVLRIGLQGEPGNVLLRAYPGEESAGEPDNLAFCHALAKRLGLVAADCQVRDHQPRFALAQRVDRVLRSSGPGGDDYDEPWVERLHCEDFCSALGVVEDRAFEREGGPGLAACVALVRRTSTQPAADIKQLLRWLIFNYLVGNHTATAKRLALHMLHDGPRLAPFFSLSSTAIYSGTSPRLAMRIGGEDRPDWLIRTRWQEECARIGVKYRGLKTLIDEMLSGLENLDEIASDYQQRFGHAPVVERLCVELRVRALKLKLELVESATRKRASQTTA